MTGLATQFLIWYTCRLYLIGQQVDGTGNPVSATGTNVVFTLKDNKLTGQATLFSASGERIEFEYLDGVVHGPAKIRQDL